MSLPVHLRPDAESDLAQARDWYEEQREGLGAKFLAEFQKFIDGISSFPEIYALVMKDVRRGKLNRFPYVVYYRVHKSKIEVLAVLHGSRDPKLWRARIKPG